MRILILTSEPPYPPLNGVRIKTYHLIKGLVERGHEVHLLTFAQHSTPYEGGNIRELESYCKSITVFQLYDDFRWLVKNAAANLLRNDSIVFRFKSNDFAKVLIKKVKEENVDLIHFDLIPLTQYARNVAELVPTVASVNDSYSLWLREKLLSGAYPRWDMISRKIYYAITFPFAVGYEKRVYEGFQKVHVVSKIDKNFIESLNPKIDVNVIPNGVDTQYFKPLHLSSDECSLAFVADMREHLYDALWFIKKVFARVRKRTRMSPINLYLVGVGSDSILRSEASKAEGVIVTGYVSDVRPYIDRAALSIDPTRKRCGILNHVLQSMAMAKAVVGTRSGFSAIEGTLSYGNVLVAEDENDFASKILYLLEHEDERSQIGMSARSLIEKKYTWTKIIPQYEDMYKNAIEKFNKQRW